MIQTLESNPSTKRLKDIVQHKYGAKLKLMPIADSKTMANESGYYLKEKDLCIPIVVNSLFLSTVVVADGARLNGPERMAISQLVRMVLDPVCYSTYLANKERSLSYSGNLDLLSGSVPFLVESQPTRRPLCTGSIFSRSSNPMSFNRFAHNVHEATQRWAMIRIDDLGESISSLQDILDLGPITLLIPELKDISDLNMGIIRQYVTNNHGSNDPLLLLNSQSSLIEIDRQRPLGQEIMDHFLFNQVDLTSQVFTEERIKEILEMLFYD